MIKDELQNETIPYDGSGIVPPYIQERLKHTKITPDIGTAAEKLVEIDDNEGEDNE